MIRDADVGFIVVGQTPPPPPPDFGPLAGSLGAMSVRWKLLL